MFADDSVPTFKKFGHEFQNRVIKACTLDIEFFQILLPICKTSYFKDTHQILWNIIVKFYREYNVPPSLSCIEVEIAKINDDDMRRICRNIIDEIKKDVNIIELEHAKDESHEFCADNEMETAIVDSLRLIQSGQRDAIRGRINAALKHYHVDSIGHDYFNDFEHRTKFDIRKTVPTGFGILDSVDYLDGGLANGEMGVIMAPTGGGKSFWLVNLGYSALCAGHDVIHYTFELSEVNIGRRYDARITKFPIKQIKNNFDSVKQELEKFSGGRLIIKEFPTKTANIEKIKYHVDRLRSTGFNPGLIILDYADLMRSTKSYDQKTWELEAIYEEVRGYAMELAVPIWTATQTNRSGLDGGIVGLNKIADGYVKAQVADFVAGFSNKKHLFIAKNRIGMDNKLMDVDFRPDISYIDILGESTSDENVGGAIHDAFQQWKNNK